jgi:hypothetical protein
LRIRFFAWCLAAPFLTLGIFDDLLSFENFRFFKLTGGSRMKAEKQAQSTGSSTGGPSIRLLETYVSILIIFY